MKAAGIAQRKHNWFACNVGMVAKGCHVDKLVLHSAVQLIWAEENLILESQYVWRMASNFSMRVSNDGRCAESAAQHCSIKIFTCLLKNNHS